MAAPSPLAFVPPGLAPLLLPLPLLLPPPVLLPLLFIAPCKPGMSERPGRRALPLPYSCVMMGEQHEACIDC